jgi:hypothetical protein
MTDNYAALLRQTAKIYRESLAAPDTDDMCSLAYQWQDKKHRHVWDLCKELEMAADRIEKLEAALRAIIDRAEFRMGHYVTDAVCSLARKALEGKDDSLSWNTNHAD